MGAKTSSLQTQARTQGQAAETKVLNPQHFQVRVVEGGKEKPRCLHYVTPQGDPVWTSKTVNYLTALKSFEDAQRICRQVMISPQFVPGTRVQFFKGPHRIKHSTVLKPTE